MVVNGLLKETSQEGGFSECGSVDTRALVRRRALRTGRRKRPPSRRRMRWRLRNAPRAADANGAGARDAAAGVWAPPWRRKVGWHCHSTTQGALVPAVREAEVEVKARVEAAEAAAAAATVVVYVSD